MGCVIRPLARLKQDSEIGVIQPLRSQRPPNMKQTNVLLLDLNSPCELSKSLRGIIESTQNADLRLQQETIENNDLLSRAESALPELISRVNPAVIFLVSSWNYLKRAKSIFSSLRRSPPEPPVVVVSDTDAPDG